MTTTKPKRKRRVIKRIVLDGHGVPDDLEEGRLHLIDFLGTFTKERLTDDDHPCRIVVEVYEK